MKIVFKKVILIVILSVLSGCSTPSTVSFESGKLALRRIQKTVDKSLPQGRRQISSNGREFVSNYFYIKKGKIVPYRKQKVRLFAKVTILGDRRPYTLETTVIVERWSTKSNRFEYVSGDERVAKKISQMINNRLTKSRDDRNVIDDFRAL